MKLTIKNNWEYLTYFHGASQIDEKRGGSAHVIFPDGAKMMVQFKSKPRRVDYSDMGTPCSTIRFDLVASVNVHGQTISCPLADLDIVEFTQDEKEEAARV